MEVSGVVSVIINADIVESVIIMSDISNICCTVHPTVLIGIIWGIGGVDNAVGLVIERAGAVWFIVMFIIVINVRFDEIFINNGVISDVSWCVCVVVGPSLLESGVGIISVITIIGIIVVVVVVAVVSVVGVVCIIWCSVGVVGIIVIVGIIVCVIWGSISIIWVIVVVGVVISIIVVIWVCGVWLIVICVVWGVIIGGWVGWVGLVGTVLQDMNIFISVNVDGAEHSIINCFICCSVIRIQSVVLGFIILKISVINEQLVIVD